MGSQLDDFNGRVGQVHLPDTVREAVLAAAREGAPSGAATLQVVDGDTNMRRTPRTMTRRTALRLGGIAAALAVTTAGLSLWGWHGATGDPTADGEGAGGSTPATTGNPFVLTAYAEGVPQADGSRLATGFMGPMGSVSGPPRGNTYENDWSVAHELNLGVSGDGIQSVTYQLEGEGAGTGVRFESLWTDRGSIGEGDYIPQDGTDTSFTVQVDELGHSWSLRDFARTIRVTFARDEVLDELDRQEQRLYADDMESQTDDQFQQSLSNGAQMDAQLERRVAQTLQSVTIHVTATFEDGSTQDQRYAVVACDGFEDKLQAYVDAAPNVPGDTRSERLANALALPDDLFALKEVEEG